MRIGMLFPDPSYAIVSLNKLFPELPVGCLSKTNMRLEPVTVYIN